MNVRRLTEGYRGTERAECRFVGKLSVLLHLLSELLRVEVLHQFFLSVCVSVMLSESYSVDLHLAISNLHNTTALMLRLQPCKWPTLSEFNGNIHQCIVVYIYIFIWFFWVHFNVTFKVVYKIPISNNVFRLHCG